MSITQLSSSFLTIDSNDTHEFCLIFVESCPKYMLYRMQTICTNPIV